MAASNAPEQNSVTTRDTLISTISTRAVLLGAYFDQGFIGFDNDLRMVLSTRLKSLLPDESVKFHFDAHEGKSLSLPADAIPPEADFLKKHRLCFNIA